MKKTIFIFAIIGLLGILLTFTTPGKNYSADKAGCECYLYIANNSLFDIDLTANDFGLGHLLVSKNKTYTLELLNDSPKKFKVKVTYSDPDFIEPRSFYYVSKKLGCGDTDSIFVAFTNYYYKN